MRQPSALFSHTWSRGPNPGVNWSQALNVWIIQAVVAIGPVLGALAFMIYMKTDWGISLFFLTPLALVAIPALRLRRIALFHLDRDLARDHADRCWPRRLTSRHERWR